MGNDRESSPREHSVPCPRCGGRSYLVEQYENEGDRWKYYFECENCESLMRSNGESDG